MCLAVFRPVSKRIVDHLIRSKSQYLVEVRLRGASACDMKAQVLGILQDEEKGIGIGRGRLDNDNQGYKDSSE